MKEKLSKITIYFLVVLKKFYYVLPSFTKKKNLNLDQALQTENRDPSKKCTDSNTQKQTLCFRNLQFFYYLHSDICKDLPQPEVWKQLAWLHLAEGSRWQSKC